MTSAYDLNDAEAPRDFDVIPAGTQVPIILRLLAGDTGPEGMFTESKSGNLLILSFECTITDGPYARRKIWWRMSFMPQKGAQLSKGEQTAVDITRSNVRAILEAARGYAPTDDSEAAQKARTMKSINELNELEISVVLGVEKGKNGYADKNDIKRIVPHGAPVAANTQADVSKPAGKKAAWA